MIDCEAKLSIHFLCNSSILHEVSKPDKTCLEGQTRTAAKKLFLPLILTKEYPISLSKLNHLATFPIYQRCWRDWCTTK